MSFYLVGINLQTAFPHGQVGRRRRRRRKRGGGGAASDVRII